jgi:hypothetical protein
VRDSGLRLRATTKLELGWLPVRRLVAKWTPSVLADGPECGWMRCVSNLLLSSFQIYKEISHV